MIRFFLCVIVMLMASTPAYAACTGPAGVEGKVIYNADHKFVQFCDGTDWVAMSGAGSVDDLGDHTATQDLDMASFKIINIGTPTAGTDAASKAYVDAAAAAAQDNLGNHTATQNVNIATHAMTSSAGTIRDASGGWVRTYGATGWYNGTHGGGWHMSDATWIRSYGSKNVYVNTVVRADGGFQVDGAEAISGSGRLNADSQRIINVATPSSSTDAANKAYVDANAGGSLSVTTRNGSCSAGDGNSCSATATCPSGWIRSGCADGSQIYSSNACRSYGNGSQSSQAICIRLN